MQLTSVAILAVILSAGSAVGSGSVGPPAVLTAAGAGPAGASPPARAAVGGAGWAGASPPARVAVGGPGYRPPLPEVRVLTRFTPPPDRYGPGHLGLDLATATGAAVVAAGSGVVRFAGPVAGRGVVVLVHPDGISTEYEPVAATVVAGQRVLAGQRIATVTGSHRGCLPATCLHWGARRGTVYLDPLSLLGPLGIVRLLPWT